MNQANIFYIKGELNEAMKLYKEKERICRELRNMSGIATSLINQALCFFEMDPRKRKSLQLAEQAYQIVVEYGYIQLAEQIKPILQEIKAGMIE